MKIIIQPENTPMTRIAVSLFFLSCTLFSCTQPQRNIPEPDYNPHQVESLEYVPFQGTVVNMDTVAKPVAIPFQPTVLKGKQEFIPHGAPYKIIDKPLHSPVRSKKINMDSVAPPEYVEISGKEEAAPWPKWFPGRHPVQSKAAFSFSTLNTDQGLYNEFILDMLEDRRGRIWINHEGAISIWDGTSFAYLNRGNGVSDLHLRMAEDRQGWIWITGWKGLSIWDGQQFWHYQSENKLNRIVALLEDRHGNIWMGHENGLNRWDGAGFHHYTIESGLPNNQVQSLLEDRQGNIWIGTGAGLCKWDGQGFVHYSMEESLSDQHIFSLLEDHNGELWIGTENTLSKWNGSNDFTHYPLSNYFPIHLIMSLAEDHNGNIWAGSSTGAAVWDGQGFTYYSTHEGLGGNDARVIRVRQNGQVLIGGYSGGSLTVWNPSGFMHFLRNSTLGNIYIRKIIEDAEGTIWAAGDRRGALFRWQEDGITRFYSGTSFERGTRGVMPDSKGRIWVIGWEGMVGFWKDNEFHMFLEGEHSYFPEKRITDILEDRQGRIWIARDGGVSVWDGVAITHYTTREGLLHNEVWKLLEDQNEDIWIGSSNGLCRWDGHSFTHYPLNADIDALFEDREGRIWVGVTGKGAAILDETGFAFFPNTHGMIMKSITQDTLGRVWIGTDQGLKCLRWEAGSDLPLVQAYDTRDGLPGNFISYLFSDSQGFLWIGTPQGLSRLDLEKQSTDTIPPRVFLRELQPLFGHLDWRHRETEAAPSEQSSEQPVLPITPDSVYPFTNLPVDPVFPHNFDEFSISWSGFSSKPHQLQYTYFLEGHDQAWSPLFQEAIARFQNLRPGSYTLKVRAVDHLGRWSDTATYSFTIRPPWWQTRVALMAYLALAGGLIWSFVRWRTAALKSRQKALERTVAERTAEVVAQQQRSDQLLLNILPEKVAEELKHTGQTKPVSFTEVSILFADFKEFTTIVASIPGPQLVAELNDIFQHFDDIMDATGLEKIQTVGDAYVAACGLPVEDPEHAVKCVQAARQMIQYLELRNETNSIKWKLRVGIHSGTITAGVVGKKKFTYDIFGDTVNIAARIESASEEGRINVSAYTHHLIKEVVPCEYRGKVNAKGKGDLDMYFVSNIQNPSMTVHDRS